MNIKIEKLIENPEWIPQLAEMWYENLGRIWVQEATSASAIEKFTTHLNEDKLPICYVATYQNQPIGIVCLRTTEGFRDEFTPWMGGLVVAPTFQHQGVGKKLIEHVKKQAISFGYSKLHLLTFESTLADWYAQQGWYVIDHDTAFGHSIIIMGISLI